MKIVFATNNENKLREVADVLEKNITIVGLRDIACYEDIPENENTIEGNASAKANYVFRNYKVNCFADDTGLEVYALDMRPGVYSARYAGDEKNDEANIDKILDELSGVEDRRARFRTVISLLIDGKETTFEGIIEGKIALERKGSGGFGYDAVFVPDTYSKTFAEMSLSEKNTISHRAIAVRKLVDYLQNV